MFLIVKFAKRAELSLPNITNKATSINSFKLNFFHAASGPHRPFAALSLPNFWNHIRIKLLSICIPKTLIINVPFRPLDYDRKASKK